MIRKLPRQKNAARQAPAQRGVPRPWRRLLRHTAIATATFATTVILLTLTFQPLNWWPLAFVAFVPWTVATCRLERAWLIHWGSFLAGWAFFAVTLEWLSPVTGLGWLALAFYLAIYWPLAAWAIRSAQRRGIAATWSLPVVWVACEYLRAFVMSGFPWLFVAHPFAAVLPFIQISDLGGAYAVSFVVLMINGWLAELVLQHRRLRWGKRRRRQLIIGGLTTATLTAATLAYGFYRLSQADQFRPGPTVSVLQEDFLLYSDDPSKNAFFNTILNGYVALAVAAAQDQPDLIVFPETVWSGPQNKSFLAAEPPDDPTLKTYHRYGRFADTLISAIASGDYAAANAMVAENRWLRLNPLPPAGGPPTTVVFGSKAIELFPESIPAQREYNSALVYNPDGTQRDERYDKIHLVPFGERVPFQHTDFHWLYRWLNSLSPFSQGGAVDYSLTPGNQLTPFELTTDEGTFTFGIPICYEDVMPYIARHYVWHGGQRRVDFLVNISNDGWFLHSAELPQHLAIGVFRAVENRVAIARAVNTGISGFIDPNGRTYGLVRDGDRRYGPGVVGVSTERVLIDSRRSFYGLTGDWLAGLCLLLAVALWLEGMVARWLWAARLRLQAWRQQRRLRRASG